MLSNQSKRPARPTMPRAVRDAVLHEFNHRCAICGKDRPQVHHIDENNANNDPANLLPLCPNHHLTDQHDPTRQFDPLLLRLFRRYKDPLMLSPRFQPVFRRLKPLMEIPDDVDFWVLQGLAGEVSAFIARFAMGDYYHLRVAQHFEFQVPSFPVEMHEQVFASALAGLKAKITNGMPHVLDLIVEQLRYQDWPPMVRVD